MVQESGNRLKEVAVRESQSDTLDVLQSRVAQLESAVASDMRRVSGPAPVAFGQENPAPTAARGEVGDDSKRIALGCGLLGAVLPIGAAFLKTMERFRSAWTPGGVVALSATLFIMALVVRYPAMLKDNQPGEADSEASTMRILCLAIVGCFCVIVLRKAWNLGELPSLDKESNWVWLITAALGGKALQKYAELKGSNGGQASSSSSGNGLPAATQGSKT